MHDATNTSIALDVKSAIPRQNFSLTAVKFLDSSRFCRKLVTQVGFILQMLEAVCHHHHQDHHAGHSCGKSVLLWPTVEVCYRMTGHLVRETAIGSLRTRRRTTRPTSAEDENRVSSTAWNSRHGWWSLRMCTAKHNMLHSKFRQENNQTDEKPKTRIKFNRL